MSSWTDGVREGMLRGKIRMIFRDDQNRRISWKRK